MTKYFLDISRHTKQSEEFAKDMEDFLLNESAKNSPSYKDMKDAYIMSALVLQKRLERFSQSAACISSGSVINFVRKYLSSSDEVVNASSQDIDASISETPLLE